MGVLQDGAKSFRGDDSDGAVSRPVVSELETLIRAVFGEHGEEAMSVMWCESGGDPNAVSWTGESFGLFQINSIHRFEGFGERWMIPEHNIAWAYELWSEQGNSWSAWACKP